MHSARDNALQPFQFFKVFMPLMGLGSEVMTRRCHVGQKMNIKFDLASAQVTEASASASIVPQSGGSHRPSPILALLYNTPKGLVCCVCKECK